MVRRVTTRNQVGRVLVGMAVLVPALAVAALIVVSRVSLVHYQRRALVTWIAVDAVVLLLGMALMGGEGM